MKFKRFGDIENTGRALTINYIQQNRLSGGLWVATEKVDGANFSMWADSKDFRAGKRNSMLQPSEYQSFFSSHTVVEKYEPHVRELRRFVKADFKAKDVRIYGELYGGYYPGAEPETSPGASRIASTRVFYCPHNDFIGYRVVVDGTYMGMLAGLELLEQFEIPAVPILGIGSFEEMLNIPNDSITQIPLYHKMKPIPDERFKGMVLEEKGNIIEGYVVAPDEPVFMGSGSFLSLKNKNLRFTEKETVKKEKTVTPLTPEQEFVYADMKANVTENRLRSVLSKIGTVTQKDFGMLLGQMTGDVIKDHMLDNPENGLETLEKKDRKIITKMINQDVGNLIRPNFQNIIDGMW